MVLANQIKQLWDKVFEKLFLPQQNAANQTSLNPHNWDKLLLILNCFKHVNLDVFEMLEK